MQQRQTKSMNGVTKLKNLIIIKLWLVVWLLINFLVFSTIELRAEPFVCPPKTYHPRDPSQVFQFCLNHVIPSSCISNNFQCVGWQLLARESDFADPNVANTSIWCVFVTRDYAFHCWLFGQEFAQLQARGWYKATRLDMRRKHLLECRVVGTRRLWHRWLGSNRLSKPFHVLGAPRGKSKSKQESTSEFQLHWKCASISAAWLCLRSVPFLVEISTTTSIRFASSARR